MMLSLGAYPGDSYFDPNRPSWLPYWIDSPTESAMKWGMYPGADVKATYPGTRPAPPPVPTGGHSGAVTDPRAVDAVVGDSAGAYRQDVARTFDDVAAGLDAGAAAADEAATRRWILFALAGAVLLIVARR